MLQVIAARVVTPEHNHLSLASDSRYVYVSDMDFKTRRFETQFPMETLEDLDF